MAEEGTGGLSLRVRLDYGVIAPTYVNVVTVQRIDESVFVDFALLNPIDLISAGRQAGVAEEREAPEVTARVSARVVLPRQGFVELLQKCRTIAEAMKIPWADIQKAPEV